MPFIVNILNGSIALHQCWCVCVGREGGKYSYYCRERSLHQYILYTDVNEPSYNSSDLHKTLLNTTWCRVVLTHVAHVAFGTTASVFSYHRRETVWVNVGSIAWCCQAQQTDQCLNVSLKKKTMWVISGKMLKLLGWDYFCKQEKKKV